MRIEREDSLVLVIDAQEKLIPHMKNKEESIPKMSTLVRGAKVFGCSRYCRPPVSAGAR